MASSTVATRPDVVAGPPRASLVRWWGAAGVVTTVVALVGWTRWIIDGPTRAPIGPDEQAAGGIFLIRFIEVASILMLGYVLWRFMIRPWHRNRALGLDGMILLAAFLSWFYDPMVNYFNYGVAYNANFVNFGSWANYIPGWEYPNMRFYPEPTIAVGAAYFWFCFGAILLGCAVLRKLRARYPNLSTFALFAAMAVVIMAVDFVLEFLVLRGQVWSFPGAPRSITLWAGKYYQYPIYEGVFTGIWVSGMTAVRYLRDDNGRSFVERGVENLRVSPKLKNLCSFFAVTGYIHVTMIVLYFVPVALFSAKADTTPPLPSYLRAGICGEGTDYACPSEYVPLPHSGSLHVRPDDPALPTWVRDRQDDGR